MFKLLDNICEQTTRKRVNLIVVPLMFAKIGCIISIGLYIRKFVYGHHRKQNIREKIIFNNKINAIYIHIHTYNIKGTNICDLPQKKKIIQFKMYQ